MASTSLIFTRCGTGDRQHLWLTAEGWVYFVLALIDMASHLLPAGRAHAEAFKAIDTVLGVTSFLPVLFYTLFILLFSRAELICVLPAQFRTVSKLMLPIFIILIGIFNQLASLVGISHDIITPGRSVILVGFKDDKDQTLWTFFTSVTLALLAAYQAINAAFAAYRLLGACRDKRRIETTEADEARLLNGTGWICGGLKLGAIETVVGFAGGTFGVALSRRILRFLARAFVCIGISKGMDSLEDFTQVQRELVLNKARRQEYRQSRIRAFISNPRLSTFRQLSPTATAFHAAPRAPVTLMRPSPLSSVVDDSPNMTQYITIHPAATFQLGGEPYQRVTVNFKNGTPILDVRLSDLEVPSIIRGKSESRSRSRLAPGSRALLSRSPSNWRSSPRQNQTPPVHTPSSMLSFLDISADSGSEEHSSPRFSNPYPQEPERRMTSLSESYTSPLAAVRELTPQFPLVPPRSIIPANRLTIRHGEMDFSNRGSPIISDFSDNTANFPPTTSLPLERLSAASVVDPSTRLSHLPPGPAPTIPAGHNPRTRTPDAGALSNVGTVIRADRDKQGKVKRSSKLRADPAEWIDYGAIQPPGGGSGEERPLWGSSEPRGMDVRRKEEEGGVASVVTVGTRGSTIKSIGTVPRRWTPAPITTRVARGSTYLEPIVISSVQPGSAETVQGASSLDSGHSRG